MVIKPIVKWVGGKSQIIKDILDKVPHEINNYYEPFVGGGSVIFSILNSDIHIGGEINVYDINPYLIAMYNDIKYKPKELYLEIKNIIDVFNGCKNSTINRKPLSLSDALNNKENYYYWIRKEFNSIEGLTVQKSAMFIFLNRTCFRGLYREGPRGFNVPYGHYQNPRFVTRDELLDISEGIQCINFSVSDFKDVLNKEFNGDDFIYLDPPYVPENSKSFTKYNKSDFTLDDHKDLFNSIKKLSCKFTMSNSFTLLVRENFCNYNITKIMCKRRINSKKPDSTTNDVLITNFV